MTSTFNGVVVGLNERVPSSDDVYPLLNLLWGQGSAGTVHFVLTPLGSRGAAPRLGPGAIGSLPHVSMGPWRGCRLEPLLAAFPRGPAGLTGSPARSVERRLGAPYALLISALRSLSVTSAAFPVKVVAESHPDSRGGKADLPA